MHGSNMDGFVPLPQAARALGVRWAVAYGLLLSGELEGERRPRGWYVKAISVAAYLDRKTKGTSRARGRR